LQGAEGWKSASRPNGEPAKRYRTDHIHSCICSPVFSRYGVYMSACSYVSIDRLECDGIVLLGACRFDTLLRIENFSSVTEYSKQNLSDAGNPPDTDRSY